MTSQHHESMKTLISGLNITSYQGLLKTALDETERQTIQTLLRDEEVWLKQHTAKGDSKLRPRTGRQRRSSFWDGTHKGLEFKNNPRWRKTKFRPPPAIP